MIKDAIKFLQDNAKKAVIEINGKKYNCKTDNTLIPLEEIDKKRLNPIDPIQTQTLTSLIDYLAINPDKLLLNKLYIVVKNENTVYLETVFQGDYEEKKELMFIHYKEPSRKLEKFLTLEELLIMLNSTFELNDDLENLVKILSKVTENDVKETEDDGLSQAVKIKSGIELMREKKLPRLLNLIPYRTFPEVTQIEIPFLLRAKKGHRELEYALFEADGGAWKNKAILEIREWLKEKLSNNKNIPDNFPILA